MCRATAPGFEVLVLAAFLLRSSSSSDVRLRGGGELRVRVLRLWSILPRTLLRWIASRPRSIPVVTVGDEEKSCEC